MTPITTKTLHDPGISSDKPTGCAWGRTFTKIISGIGQVAKAALVFGFFLAPTVASSLYMSPGQVLARAGTASCGLNKYAFSPEHCNKVTTALYTEYMLNSHHPSRFTPLEREQIHEKGVERPGQNEYEGTTFHFLIPQKRMESYEKAVSYAKWAFSHYKWNDPNKTIELLKQLHRILVAHSHDTGIVPLDTAPEIAEQMDAFIRDFHKRMQAGGDYIDHASYFHVELTRIAPFNTGLGRLARLMLNIILEIGEEPPVVFADRSEYISKVKEGSLLRADFTRYLRNSIDWTQKNIPQVDDRERRSIINEAKCMYPGLIMSNVGRETTVKGKILIQDPQKYFNYQHALSHLRQHNIFELSAEEFLDLLNGLHILLTQNIEQDEDDPFILGKYRSSYMIVDGIGDPLTLIVNAQVLLGPRFEQFIPLFNTIRQDITYLGRLNKEEKALWAKIAHIPPPPYKVAEEMLKFAKAFLAKSKDDPYALAGFVHMEMARIWPYSDANGRLGRMLMNEVLRLHGKRFITFPTQVDYYKVVANAIEDYSIFTSYISRL